MSILLTICRFTSSEKKNGKEVEIGARRIDGGEKGHDTSACQIERNTGACSRDHDVGTARNYSFFPSLLTEKDRGVPYFPAN